MSEIPERNKIDYYFNAQAFELSKYSAILKRASEDTEANVKEIHNLDLKIEKLKNLIKELDSKVSQHIRDKEDTKSRTRDVLLISLGCIIAFILDILKDFISK